MNSEDLRTFLPGFVDAIHDWLVEDEIVGVVEVSVWAYGGLAWCLKII
jgi:hypothetical protein